MSIPVHFIWESPPGGEATNINQTLDKRVIRKIYSIVANGIFNFNEVRNRLTEYVESEICASMSPEDRPSRSNRCFFPSKRDLRNYIFRALTSQKHCKDDQESLRRKIEQWRQGNPNSNFFYRTILAPKTRCRKCRMGITPEKIWQRKRIS